MENQLKTNFEVIMKEAKQVMEAFPWEDPKAYALWLNQTHFFVDNSTRLIALAGALFSKEQNSLHQRFIDHSKEERGHEKLLQRDIATVGFKQEELEVYPATRAFYQCQFYWIEHVNPISFFGYILFLEGLAVVHAPWVIARLEKAHGSKSVSFLKLHSDEDEDHLEKAFSLVNKATPQEMKQINENLEVSSQLYLQFLKEITLAARQTPHQQKKAG